MTILPKCLIIRIYISICFLLLEIYSRFHCFFSAHFSLGIFSKLVVLLVFRFNSSCVTSSILDRKYCCFGKNLDIRLPCPIDPTFAFLKVPSSGSSYHSVYWINWHQIVERVVLKPSLLKGIRNLLSILSFSKI